MIPSFHWFKRGMTAAMSCGLLFFGACNKNGGDGVKYTNSYAGVFETATSFQFFAQTVNFTINWNESNGTITGTHQDDYFAKSGVTISGSTSKANFHKVTVHDERRGHTPQRDLVQPEQDRPASQGVQRRSEREGSFASLKMTSFAQDDGLRSR